MKKTFTQPLNLVYNFQFANVYMFHTLFDLEHFSLLPIVRCRHNILSAGLSAANVLNSPIECHGFNRSI